MGKDNRLAPHHRSPQTNDGQWVHHDVAAAILGVTIDRLNYLNRTGRGPAFRQAQKRAPRMYHMDNLRTWIKDNPKAA